MRSEIKLIGVFGHERKFVWLTQPSGAGGGYQLYIEHRYQGMILKKDGRWISQLTQPHDFTADDIYVLGELIDNELDA